LYQYQHTLKHFENLWFLQYFMRRYKKENFFTNLIFTFSFAPPAAIACTVKIENYYNIFGSTVWKINLLLLDSISSIFGFDFNMTGCSSKGSISSKIFISLIFIFLINLKFLENFWTQFHNLGYFTMGCSLESENYETFFDFISRSRFPYLLTKSIASYFLICKIY
jgi:hypothetical protein